MSEFTEALTKETATKEDGTIWRLTGDDFRAVIDKLDEEGYRITRKEEQDLIEEASYAFTLDDWMEHVEAFLVARLADMRGE